MHRKYTVQPSLLRFTARQPQTDIHDSPEPTGAYSTHLLRLVSMKEELHRIQFEISSRPIRRAYQLSDSNLFRLQKTHNDHRKTSSLRDRLHTTEPSPKERKSIRPSHGFKHR
ncbi:hypothetical protein Rs2_20152 [Raphanus sativus]|nr:hypothetical protein Rs2_20152 [Raphanus sativus]